MNTIRSILAALLGLLPLVVSAQPVISARLDFPPLALGASDEREVRIANLPQNVTYVIKDTCDSPFRVTTPGKDLVSRGGELRIRIAFQPTQPGLFRDELLLEQRPPSLPTAERIRIRLSGTGFRIELIERLSFGDVITGDSVRKLLLIRPNMIRDVRWSMMPSPTSPFSTPDATAPFRGNQDSVGFRFAYAPTRDGRVTDTIGLIRTFVPTGVPLDTIRVILDGNAVSMQDSADVLFRDLTPGMTVSADLSVQLPATPVTRDFSYTLVPRTSSGVVSGVVKDPKSASRSMLITCSFTARPRTSRSVREQFVLRRLRADGKVVDSTIITAVVIMLPQPIVFSARFSSDTLVHRIGDTVSFEIVAASDTPLTQPVTLSELIAECAINSTVLVPIRTDRVSVITRDDRTYVRITLPEPITITASGDVLLRWSGIVVLGDADHSPLALEPVSATTGSGMRITIEATSAVLRVANVWTMPDGSQRLVNPRLSQLRLTVAPNPISDAGTISVANVPSGEGRLEIVDSRGIIVADLTAQLRSGRRDFSVAAGGTADVTLQPGVYYVRLTAQLSPSDQLSSVVRSIVVR